MDKEKIVEKKTPPPGLKPCCACPETRKVRDNCVLTSENGPDDCLELIEAHKNCLRELGFKV